MVEQVQRIFSTFSGRNADFSYCYNLKCLFRDYVTKWNDPHHVISKSGFDPCSKLEPNLSCCSTKRAQIPEERQINLFQPVNHTSH